MAVPVHVAHAATRAIEAFLIGNVPEPVRRPAARQHDQRRHRQRAAICCGRIPQFGTFAIEEYDGIRSLPRRRRSSSQKRFRNGNSLTAQYTRSSLRDKLNYLNPPDGELEDRVSPNDRPNRFSIGSGLRLPFGRGEQWGSGLERPAVDAILGGWQVSGTYQYQNGVAAGLGAASYYDAAAAIRSGLKSNIGKKVARRRSPGSTCRPGTSSCFYFHDAPVQTNGVDNPALQRADPRIQLGNNVRYFPSTLPDVRTDNLHLLDIGLSKNFALPRGMRLQFRLEAINALNYTVLWNPDVNPRNATFGFINQDRNNPRDIQIGAAVHVLTSDRFGGWTAEPGAG